MKKEAPLSVDPLKTETVEKTLERLNRIAQLPSASIEAAKNLKKSIEELEEAQKIPPEVWNKEFAI
jgi:hypothetical protein